MKKRLLTGFFNFLRPIVRFALRVFYRHMPVSGASLLQKPGPVIYVSNHPNTLIDPFMVAIHSNRIIHFLANAGLFDSRFGFWFFSTFFCFPIQRSIDKVSRQIDNDHSFDRMQEFLTNGGALFIAAEGGSEVGRYVKPLRTGTARIALNKAAFLDWQTDLTILPIGLIYEDPARFRSSVWVKVGDPIRVADYQALHESDAYQAVRGLTHDIENQLIDLTLHMPDVLEEKLLLRLMTILDNLYPGDFIAVVKKIKDLQKSLSSQSADDLKGVEGYFDRLEELEIGDITVQQCEQGLHRSFGAMILGFPIFCWGFFNNLLVWALAELPLKMTDMYPTYHSTVRFLGGFLGVLLFYPMQYFWVLHHFGLPSALAYLLSLIPTGIFAAFFVRKWKQWLDLRNFRKLALEYPDECRQLQQQRKAIIAHWKL